jgi:glycosyltransferase involved in cell wall biosynthesis
VSGVERRPPPAPGVSVVIPALDEERGIGPTLAAVSRALAEVPGPHEIVVVDDGSRDRTAEVALAAGARVFAHPVPAGYGASLKAGIRAASHERIVICDADGTYPVGRIPELVQALDAFDLVIGARTGPLYRRAWFLSPLRTLFLLLVRFVTGTDVPDPNSGLRAFRRSAVLPLLPRLPRGFSFTTTQTLILTLSGKFVLYVPVAYGARIGRSKVRLLRDGLRATQTMVEVILLHNPLKLFLALAAPPASLGAALLVAAPWFPRALPIAVVLLATALVVFSAGLVAVTIAIPRRQR